MNNNIKRAMATLFAVITFFVGKTALPTFAADAEKAMPSTYEEMAKLYLDFNNNGSNEIADVVCAFKLLDGGKIAESDYLNCCNIVVGNDVEIGYEVVDVNEDTQYNDIQDVFSSYIVDLDFNDDGSRCSMRVMNDGIVKELRASVDEVVDPLCLSIFERDNETIAFGMARGGEFVFDTFSFDIPTSETVCYIKQMEKLKLEQFVATESTVNWLTDLNDENNYILYATLNRYTWGEPTKTVAYYKDSDENYVLIKFTSYDDSAMDQILFEKKFGSKTLTFGITHDIDECPEGHLVCNIKE